MKEEKFILKGKRLEEIQDFCKSIGVEAFRAKQLYTGIYKNRYTSISQFTTFSKELIAKISENAEYPEIQLGRQLISKDGTRKFTFEVEPGKEIETVWIPTADEERKTICISSQVGCTLNCAFCATGLLEYKGNLHAWQILDQIIQVEKIVGDRATNIVFMGMGEPMHNYFSVMKAAHILHDKDAFGLGAKRITISTAGVVTGITRFIENKEPFNFAISLNHPNPNTRHTIMDVNVKHPLEKLLAVARRFTQELDRMITFEYVLIPDVNMGRENADRLVKIARSVNKCKINVIPLNTDFTQWRRPTEDEVGEFVSYLRAKAGVPILNRQSPGRDINGACGMLALKGTRKEVEV
ncbi:putative dual-specificity RNA methyltransferase RlmN [Leptospira kobayashii]|uniref:Probable dual-specificity RNA methyltransferase RlmN n=1 Tax=Leptospira kobayashii TaxID=1917830 RepID=A0ABN6KFG2_9LEPT|nr:23S rRNA (adenine(2503)-C(2))-methyltransferase RlmN [Leptospira kobayashii]BDA78378.1 putative dual-specificity RNA methyltransferase RlmN [Leptospira kobayashii]